MTMTPNLVWVDLGEFDWEDIPETLTLKPQDVELTGNVLCNFETLDIGWRRPKACHVC